MTRKRGLLKSAFLCAASVAILSAQSGSWFQLVSPILTAAERKTYLSLSSQERASFEENFWTGKAITAEEYFRRIQYVDSAFGSTKPASGANTDPGRVYLAIGPPTKISRLPSSRIFVPMEIWYYDVVPGIINTEVHLIFYQQHSIGLLKLYSPTTDTVRALLLPEAATTNMFGPNDDLSESDIRNNLTVPPAEDEVVSAAVNIAIGIQHSGNDEILGQITSPEVLLRKPPETRVTSRLIFSKPNLDIVVTPSPYGGSQVDLQMETSVKRQLDIQILQDTSTVYQNQLGMSLSAADLVKYTHRLDLLPGSYQVMFTVDGKNYAYPLVVKPQATMTEILRTDALTEVSGRHTAFEFESKQVHMNSLGKFAVVALPTPQKVTWMLRRGSEVLWRSIVDPSVLSVVELPARMQPGMYQLEAVTPDDSRSTAYVVAKESPRDIPNQTFLSFNANLAPALRSAFIAHQWLTRGNLTEARKNLELSLAKGATSEAEVELARVDALSGHLDEARDRVRRVLTDRPNDFQGLAVLAYVEAKFQDYTAAAALYRRALAVQDSPAVRAALAKLPAQ